MGKRSYVEAFWSIFLKLSAVMGVIGIALMLLANLFHRLGWIH